MSKNIELCPPPARAAARRVEPPARAAALLDAAARVSGGCGPVLVTRAVAMMWLGLAFLEQRGGTHDGQ